MTEYLSLKTYKVQFVQKLDEEDFQDRVDMCITLVPMVEYNDPQESLFCSDEVIFYLHRLINKLNIRYRCETNLHVTIKSVMKSPKLNVWCFL